MKMAGITTLQWSAPASRGYIFAAISKQRSGNQGQPRVRTRCSASATDLLNVSQTVRWNSPRGGRRAARTGAACSVGLCGGPLAVEGIVLDLEAALGFGGVAPPRGLGAGSAGGEALQGAEEVPLGEHCVLLRCC
jgi:hypothetical protein